MDYNVKVREEIWKSIEAMTDEKLNEVVEQGKWSIAQVLEHLYLIEQLAAQNIIKTLKTEETNPVKLRKIHLTIDRTHKFEAPESLLPTTKFQTIDHLKEKLHNSRASLMSSIDGVSEDLLNQKSMPHPAFGALSLSQWVAFIGYHEKRHLQQIEEIKQALNSNH